MPPTSHNNAQALDSLLAFAPMGLAFFDRECRFTRVNEFLAHHHNLSVDDHVGKRLREVQQGDLRKLQQKMLDVFERKTPIPVFEQQLKIHSHADVQTFSISLFPVFDEQSEVAEVGAAFFLHEDRKPEERIQTPHELKFRHLAETLPLIVWTANPDGNLSYISPQWTELTGLVPEDDGYLNYLEFVHEDDKEETLAIWGRALETGETYSHTFRLRNLDGEHLYHTAMAVPVRDQNGNIAHWYGNVTNVDDHKQTELSLKEATQSKDMFIAVLGHELRNPLAAIATHYEVLKHPNLDAARRDKAFAQLGEQIKHLSTLVDDTLDLSRLNSGKLRVVKRPTELNQLIESAVDGYTQKAEEQQIHIRLQTSGNPLWVCGDSVRLCQCVNNLMSNAVKFTDQGGEVIVSVLCEEQENTAKIQVQDNGIGMEPGEIMNLFEPFTQSNHAFDRSKDGLGLGLSVVRQLVALHDGEIHAYSQGIGEGTSVTIHLPMIDPPSDHEGDAEEHEETVQSDPTTILVVDDDESVACSLKLFFELDGHNVHVAHDAEQAFDLFSKLDADIVFSDLTLTNAMDGWKLAERIRSHNGGSDSPYLVALSGRTQDHYVEKSLKAGFDRHLAKPPVPDEMRECIREANHRK